MSQVRNKHHASVIVKDALFRKLKVLKLDSKLLSEPSSVISKY